MANIRETILEHFDAADKSLQTKREAWDKYEDLFHGFLSDTLSNETKSRVFDPKLSSMILEREARVMAQLPTGKVKAVSKNDQGAAKLINLTLDKYILPNANAQFDFLTKCRLVDRYSNIYGNFFVMVDWDVKQNGYVGPDMWLIPIRDIFPQVGAISLDDSERIIVRTWKPISFFENLKKADGYKNIPLILEKLKKRSGSKESRETKDKSRREDQQYDRVSPAKGSGYFQILSLYEKDRWVDFCLEAELEFRDGKNPHDNSELPIVNKYSVPLLDDFFAMGDTERGAPMQYTLNSIWNLYLDAVKISIFPPTIINKDNVADINSFKFSAAAKWISRGNTSNVAQTLNLTPQGTNTFNNVYQVVTSSLLNMFGTTQTSTSSQVDPSFGKTPEALKIQASRENSKDNANRFYMEQFLTKVNKKFINLLSKKASKLIQYRMFEEEIDELSIQYPEIKQMFDEKTGKINVEKGRMGNIIYDYEIVTGSTYVADQQNQQSNLLEILKLVLNPTSNQIINQALQTEGKIINVGEIITRVIANSGIQDWDKIITDRNNNPGAIMQDHMAQFQQALQQIGGVANVPPQNGQMNTNAIPNELNQNGSPSGSTELF